jgi:hypothetical protein
MHETASQEMKEELHVALKQLDPDYNQSYSAMKDLSKMKVIGTY